MAKEASAVRFFATERNFLERESVGIRYVLHSAAALRSSAWVQTVIRAVICNPRHGVLELQAVGRSGESERLTTFVVCPANNRAGATATVRCRRPAPRAELRQGHFEKPIPGDQLADLNRFAGSPSRDAMHDKQFRRVMKSFVPDCIFHYGRDMSFPDALDMVLKDSRNPIQIRESRYMLIQANADPILQGGDSSGST